MCRIQGDEDNGQNCPDRSIVQVMDGHTQLRRGYAQRRSPCCYRRRDIVRVGIVSFSPRLPTCVRNHVAEVLDG
jgi:hypothetical protein